MQYAFRQENCQKPTAKRISNAFRDQGEKRLTKDGEGRTARARDERLTKGGEGRTARARDERHLARRKVVFPRTVQAPASLQSSIGTPERSVAVEQPSAPPTQRRTAGCAGQLHHSFGVKSRGKQRCWLHHLDEVKMR